MESDPDPGMDDVQLYASRASANVPHPIRQRSKPQAGNQSNVRRIRNLVRELGEFFFSQKRDQLNSARPRAAFPVRLGEPGKGCPGTLRHNFRTFATRKRPQSASCSGGRNRANLIIVPVGVSPSLASSCPRRFPRRSGPPICGRLPFLPSPTSAACQIPLPVPRKAARHAPAKSFLPQIPPR